MSCFLAASPPDLDESQLSVPDLLDFHLGRNDDFPLFVYAEEETNEITQIKMLEYIRACHRAGSLVQTDSQPGDVVAIIANIDALTYSALIVGIMKVGLVPFPISPRNSSKALFHLVRASSAHRVLTTSATLPDVLDGLRAETQAVDPSYVLRIEDVPALQGLFPRLGKETTADEFTPLKTDFSPRNSDLAMYLHSSGSTGLPKVVPLIHKSLKDYASVSFLQHYRIPGFCSRVSAMGLPPFHVVGVICLVLHPLFGPTCTGIFPPLVVTETAFPMLSTPDNILEMSRFVECDCMVTLPTFIQAWSQSTEAVDYLETLRFLAYGGGPLAPRTGNKLVSKGVPIVTGYGTTEFGLITTLEIKAQDWLYVEFCPGSSVRFMPQGDGTFEAHILSSNRHRVAIENLPDVAGYASSDLFEPHPTNPRYWKIIGRIDDVIVHSSGEKTVSTPMETIISANPLVKGVVMFGRQRDQPGVLIEPSTGYNIDVTDDSQISEFRNLIWPTCEEANNVAPAFSRIFKEMILIASPEKLLPRVGKGTVAKSAAIALYESEINKLYDTIEANSGGTFIDLPSGWDPMDLQAWLTGQILDIYPGKPLRPSVNIFEQGLDSLSVTILRLRLVNAMRRSGFSAPAKSLAVNVLYGYPTVDKLSKKISELVSGFQSSVTAQETHESYIEEMIENYSRGLDAPLQPFDDDTDVEKHCVLLTGSTGNLGAQLLQSLLTSERFEKVYTLNRPSSELSMFERHRVRFQDKALDLSLLSSSKLIFLEGDISQEGFGLSESTLLEMRHNLTMVIHNAWKLDFNLHLSSFEQHVKGSRFLVDLARACRHSTSLRFLFTSSIAAAQSWDKSLGPYPEELVMNPKYAVGTGYGESKYVTERILGKSGLQATSFRIGQICGGWPNGAWATTDWFPIIIASSLHLNMLPDAYGIVSWLPMDAVSSAIIEVGLNSYYSVAVNVVHPRGVPWSYIMEKIRIILIWAKHLSAEALPITSFHNWLSKVEAYAATSVASKNKIQGIPAVKLIEFFKQQVIADASLRENQVATAESAGLTMMAMEKIKKLSTTLNSLKPLDEADIERWVKYWIAGGF